MKTHHIFFLIFFLFCSFSAFAQAGRNTKISVGLRSSSPQTIEVTYTRVGAEDFFLNRWNNQTINLSWPDVAAGGPGSQLELSILSSDSGWGFNLQGSPACQSGVCRQKIISSDNNVDINFNTSPTTVITLGVNHPSISSTSFDISNVFVNHVAFGNVGIPGSGITVDLLLPVELTYFTANAQNDGTALLEWETASELNNAYFEVQHSVDGIDYKVIGFVDGSGTTQETQYYTFIHEEPITGANYYRLRQVDFDGAFEYSPIRAVNFDKTGEKFTQFRAYPNPSTNYLMLLPPDVGVDRWEVDVYDVRGRLIKSFILKDAIYRLNTVTWPSGTYHVQVKGGKHYENFRFVKG